jgi:2-oxo-3-hexenedioate decarboxylase
VSDPRQIADTLIEAERRRTPVPPFTRAQPFLGVETAYRVQQLFVEHRLQSGERVIGVKLGLTSRVKRQALGIDQPVYGRLTSGMVVAAGDRLPLDELIRPRGEPEIAFLIRDDLEGPISAAGVVRATEAVTAAVEIMDSRYSDRFRLPDSVCDNAGAARVVIGTRLRRPDKLADLRLLGCVFSAQGRVVGTAAGAAAMGDPAAAVAWLINTLAERGERLAAGSLVLTGGLTASVALQRGVGVVAQFDGLGSVEVYG